MKLFLGLRCPTPGLRSPPSLSFSPFCSYFQTSGKQSRITLSNSSASVDVEPTSFPETIANEQLTGRERRKLKNERREGKLGNSWREEVEERLATKVKKQYTPKSAELNLDSLALLGPQWWIVRVSRTRGDETALLIAKLLARNFPQLQFKVYAPAIQVKTKLKNGTYSTKSKAVFPGCAFLWCIMDKSVHDFVRECEGVGGFVGAKVIYGKRRQITKPKPVEEDAMKDIFRQAKEEQEKYDRAFQEEQKDEKSPDTNQANKDVAKNVIIATRPELLPTENSDPKGNEIQKKAALTTGSAVRVVSGNFAEFKGTIKKVNRKSGKVTVSVTLFGKESLVEVEKDEIVTEN